METPPAIHARLPGGSQRRFSSTSQLFIRLDKNSVSNRELKSSMHKREFPKCSSNQSLTSSKENLKFYSYMKKIQCSATLDESKIASNYLLSLRKEYDKMSKLIKTNSEQINTMRKDIQLMKGRGRSEENFFAFSGERVEKLKQELERLQLFQEEARMETKILEQIINRMKIDQIQRKTVSFTDEQKLKDKKRQLKQKEEELLQWDDSIHKILDQMDKIRGEFKKNTEQREQKLLDYRSQIEELSEHEKFERDRKQRTYQLLSMESNDILDAKNVVLREVLMTNKVLDKLLEGKINQLLNRYQDLQKCYHLIRIQTNISEPHLLAKKFFSYTESLEQLTQTIQEYEKRQQQLTEINKKLKQKQKQNLIKRLEEDKSLFNDTDTSRYAKESLIEEAIEKDLVVKKIRNWLDRICESLGMRRKSQGGVGVAQQIRQICEESLKKAAQVKQIEKGLHKFQSPGIRLKKAIKQFSEEDDKIRRSQAQQVAENNIFENIYLNYERKQIKKNQFQIKTQAKNAKV